VDKEFSIRGRADQGDWGTSVTAVDSPREAEAKFEISVHV